MVDMGMGNVSDILLNFQYLYNQHNTKITKALSIEMGVLKP